jgi:hypothetical protein
VSRRISILQLAVHRECRHAGIKGNRPPNAGKGRRRGVPDKMSKSLRGMILADIPWMPGGLRGHGYPSGHPRQGRIARWGRERRSNPPIDCAEASKRFCSAAA